MPDTETDISPQKKQDLILSYAGHYQYVDNLPRPMHQHRGAEFVLYTRGTCSTRTETGEVFDCRPGMLLIIPPGLKHIQYNNTTDCETFYVVFEDAAAKYNLNLRMIELRRDSMLPSWMNDIFQLCRQHEFQAASFLLNALGHHLANLESAQTNDMEHPTLKTAVSMMMKLFREDFSISEYAEKCGVSISLLNQLFRKKFGIAPRRFLIAVRMREARLLLLNPEYNISDIARETGFNTTNYFIRQFKMFHGVTPFRYRLDPAAYSDQATHSGEIFDFRKRNNDRECLLSGKQIVSSNVKDPRRDAPDLYRCKK